MADLDLCAQIAIETSLENDILVKIDEISVKQHQLLCLIDQSKWLDDDVISAYICCLRDQVNLQNRDDAKIYFENPFIIGLLKRDGSIGIHEEGNFITEIAKNYLKHEMIMFDDIQMVKKKRRMISKHYLDMQFWHITDFGRHPNFWKNLDVERLANSIRSWPGINYSVSTCKLILIPIQFNAAFILFILNKDTRIVYILDPTPLDPIYQYNPNARYIQKLLWIAEYLPKAMSKVCPGSRWNENIFLWRQIILHKIPIHNRELSGYLVSLFMSTWEGEKLHLPFLKDGYELRKQILGQLLTYEENECEDNMPAGVLEFLSCIKKQS